MTITKKTKTVLTWIPTIAVAPFFIQNGVDKILYYDQVDKVFLNSTGIVVAGIILVIATALFLYKKTAVIGGSILTPYMAMIVCIHIYKDKPFILASLIVITTIVAVYVRKSKPINKWRNV